MNAGRFVLTQVLDAVHRQSLDRLVQRYDTDARTRHFGCRQQLICMAFAQLTWRESLRDIETCLNAKPEALYHLGFSEPIARSTLADANERRNWHLWRDLAQHLITRARRLYVHDDVGLEFENTVYALDSTTIDLSLTLFPWAHFRSTKAGIKLHTQLDLRGPIPTVVDISPARQHDVRWLDDLVFESGAYTSWIAVIWISCDWRASRGPAPSSSRVPRTICGSRDTTRARTGKARASEAIKSGAWRSRSPDAHSHGRFGG